MKNHATFFRNSFLPSIWICLFPVILATAIAFGDGIANWTKAGISIGIAIILQIFFILFFNKIRTQNILLKNIFSGIFLGPMLTTGSYYFQSNEINTAVFLAGVPLGLLTVAIISLKSYKQFTAEKILRLFLWMVFTSGLMPLVIYSITNDKIYSLSASAIILMSINPIIQLSKEKNIPLDPLIITIIRMAFLYTILFSLGWII